MEYEDLCIRVESLLIPSHGLAAVKWDFSVNKMFTPNIQEISMNITF